MELLELAFKRCRPIYLPYLRPWSPCLCLPTFLGQVGGTRSIKPEGSFRPRCTYLGTACSHSCPYLTPGNASLGWQLWKWKAQLAVATKVGAVQSVP